MDAVRAAIQAVFDADGEGWQATHYVAVVAIERVTDDGVESTSWYLTPNGQADWQTAGLLASAVELRATAETE